MSVSLTFPRTDNPPGQCSHRQNPPQSLKIRFPRTCRGNQSRTSSCWPWCTRRCSYRCRHTHKCPAVALSVWSACWRSPCGSPRSTFPLRKVFDSEISNPSSRSYKPGPPHTAAGPRCSPWRWSAAGTARSLVWRACRRGPGRSRSPPEPGRSGLDWVGSETICSDWDTSCVRHWGQTRTHKGTDRKRNGNPALRGTAGWHSSRSADGCGWEIRHKDRWLWWTRCLLAPLPAPSMWHGLVFPQGIDLHMSICKGIPLRRKRFIPWWFHIMSLVIWKYAKTH